MSVFAYFRFDAEFNDYGGQGCTQCFQISLWPDDSKTYTSLWQFITQGVTEMSG